MEAFLIRVAIDITKASGCFNAPINPETNEFTYVPIQEHRNPKSKLITTFEEFVEPCTNTGFDLPARLQKLPTHLDPDFSKLTYGDVDGIDLASKKMSYRGRPLKTLKENDVLVFYASLKPTKPSSSSKDKLIYAIIGLFVLKESYLSAAEFCRRGLGDSNAHTRCEYNDADIIFAAKSGKSGRLERCLPIGEYRDKAYRVNEPFLAEWGGFSNNTRGYLQRSGTLWRFKEPERFCNWLEGQLTKNQIHLIQRNN
jgi:hypothetical protein